MANFWIHLNLSCFNQDEKDSIIHMVILISCTIGKPSDFHLRKGFTLVLLGRWWVFSSTQSWSGLICELSVFRILHYSGAGRLYSLNVAILSVLFSLYFLWAFPWFPNLAKIGFSATCREKNCATLCFRAPCASDLPVPAPMWRQSQTKWALLNRLNFIGL